MKKLFYEFKKFISRGNAVDLAVGMIIGSAFTAIVTALVNNILKPLINWIPISGTTGLQTVLRKAVTDETGAVIVQPLILDWGAVISAIITFLLTALVLFVIVKAINTAREGGKGLKHKLKKMTQKGRAALEAEEKAKAEAEAQAQAEAEAAELAKKAEEAKIEAARLNQQKTVELLEQILAKLNNK